MSIIYTPLPIEMVLDGIDKEYPQYKEIDYGGAKLLVEPSGGDKYRIIRLLSTNPMDYLRNELQPGTEINLVPQTCINGEGNL